MRGERGLKKNKTDFLDMFIVFYFKQTIIGKYAAVLLVM